MNSCTKCGAPLEEDMTICPSCGEFNFPGHRFSKRKQNIGAVSPQVNDRQGRIEVPLHDVKKSKPEIGAASEQGLSEPGTDAVVKDNDGFSTWPGTNPIVKDDAGFSPWWFRFGLPIVGIDIFIQALLIWGWATTQPSDLGIGFATFLALFIIIPGNLIALMLTPMAVSNLRLKGEGRATVILCLAVWTGPLVALYDSRPSSVNAERGEWRTVTPGKPLAKFPTVRVIEEGKGPVVGVGNLVKVHLRYHVTDPDKWIDNGDWWIWTGFYVSKVETPLYTVSPRIASALIGLREGSLFDIVDAHDVPNTGRVADSLFTAMLSPTMGKYEILKHINGTIEHNTTIFVSSPSKPGTELRILTTCKAEMQVRTVRLWDDSRVRMQSGNPDREGGMREVSVEETRVQGKCSDGHTATFSHGPERLVTKDGRYPDYSGWVKDEWEKLPVGVQVR